MVTFRNFQSYPLYIPLKRLTTNNLPKIRRYFLLNQGTGM